MSERIIAIVRLVAPLLATLLTFIGVEMDAELIVIVLLAVVSIVAFIWAWWKNNNVTIAAQEAQKYLTVLKTDHAVRIEDGDKPANVEVTDGD